MEKYQVWKGKEVAYFFLGLIIIELTGLLIWKISSPSIHPYFFTFYIRVIDFIFIYFFLKVKRKNFSLLGFINLLKGLKGGLIVSLSFFIGILIFSKFLPQKFLGLISTNGNTKLLLIAYCTIPPVVEEIVFRGVFYDFLKERMKKWIAIFISSFIFSLFHISPLILLVVPFAGGIVFCILKDKFNSLWAPLTFHILGNLSIIVIPYLT